MMTHQFTAHASLQTMCLSSFSVLGMLLSFLCDPLRSDRCMDSYAAAFPLMCMDVPGPLMAPHSQLLASSLTAVIAVGELSLRLSQLEE